MSALAITFGGYSLAGVKAENQDAFSALMPAGHDCQSKGFVACIADGLSCASHAKNAAQLVVTQFVSDYFSTPATWSTEKSANQVITSMNSWMFAQSETLAREPEQWFTTFTSLIVKSATGYVFHVGDSRLSVFKQGKLQAVTRDHNQGRATKQAVLTRALGADFRLSVDLHQLSLEVGELYLLTTDGLHDVLTAQYISQQLALLPEKPNKQCLEQASNQLVADALAHGSEDNISCLLVYIEQLPKHQQQEVEQALLSKTVLPALDVGMKLDGYQISKVLHQTPRSHLYLVKQSDAEQPLVLKVPSVNFADDAIYLQGFIREAWLGEQLNHPNIMKIKASSQNSQYLYHFCEYIEGQTLTAWMHDHPTPTLGQVRDIVEQIISALRALQRLDVVHRDLKPDNIMIDAFGKITLIDYGSAFVASLAENNDTLEEQVPQGSLDYIAPETLLHLTTSHQSDLFALGVICYQLLCGTLPYKPMSRYQANRVKAEYWQYRSIRQNRAELPIWLDLALKKATEPMPNRRYQAYSEFLADLTQPNQSALESYQNQPLLTRDPVRFWQAFSGFLAICLLISLLN